MKDKRIERKEMLKKAGYFTVEILLEKLQELKEKGCGDKMVVGMDGHFQYCEYSSKDDEILIC